MTEERFEMPAPAESLAEAIEWFVVDQFGMCERSHEIASTILAMPAMQAIKTALLMSSIDVGLANNETKEDALRRRGLPESVVWWVLRRE